MPAVSGVVRVVNASGILVPAQRLVRLYRAGTGAYVGSTLSDASTGAWSIPTADTRPHFAIRHDTNSVDPYWDKVSLLFNFDDAAGTVSFKDDRDKAFSTFGDAKIASASGVNFLQLDGAGDWIETPTSVDLSLPGDFSIEARVMITAFTKNYGTFLSSGATTFSSGSYFLMAYGNAAPIAAQRNRFGFGSYASSPLLLSGVVALNQWYDLGVFRTGSAMIMTLDGAVVASASNTALFDFSNTKTLIGINGWDGAASHFAGRIKRLRVTKGFGRQTGAYTPSTTSWVGAPASVVEADQIIGWVKPK